MLVHRVCVTIAVLTGFAGCAASPRSISRDQATLVITDPTARRIDTYLTSLVPFGFSGALLLEREGAVILEKGYGFSDRNRHVVFTPTTPSEIASLTKQFTAALILQLAESRMLRVSDSLSRFIPSAPADKASITIGQLLSHTSGLPRDVGEYFVAAEREEFMRTVLSARLRSAPGERYFYSNAGYKLLALVAELVTGEPVERLVRDKLFHRAGMRESGFYGRASPPLARPPAHFYTGPFDRGGPDDLVGPAWYMKGNGGAITTVADLYRWELALRNHTVLSPASTRELFEGRAKVSDHVSYAYGWFVRDTLGVTLFEHGGDFALGTNSEFVRLPERRTTMILLSNASARNGIAFRTAVQDFVLQALLGRDSSRSAIDARLPSAQDAKRFSGRYALPDGATVDVGFDGAYLWLGADGQRAVAFLRGEDTTLTRRATEASAGTSVMLTRLMRGDTLAFAEAMAGASDANEYLEEWRDLTRSQGELRSFRVLGGIPVLRMISLRVELVFDRANVTYIYFWGGSPRLRLTGSAVDFAPYADVALLAPSGQNRLVTFNLFSGESRVFHLDSSAFGASLCTDDPAPLCARRIQTTSPLDLSLRRVMKP